MDIDLEKISDDIQDLPPTAVVPIQADVLHDLVHRAMVLDVTSQVLQDYRTENPEHDEIRELRDYRDWAAGRIELLEFEVAKRARRPPALARVEIPTTMIGICSECGRGRGAGRYHGRLPILPGVRHFCLTRPTPVILSGITFTGE